MVVDEIERNREYVRAWETAGARWGRPGVVYMYEVFLNLELVYLRILQGRLCLCLLPHKARRALVRILALGLFWLHSH